MIDNQGPVGTVVVTGASSGIGRALAIRLAHAGDVRLLLTGRDPERLGEVARECSALAPRVHSFVGDLRDRACVAALTAEVERLAPIAGLANCAGIGRFGPTASFSDADWDELITTNLSALFALCRDIGVLLCRQGRGTILNVSSDADSTGFYEAAAYCASKGGVLALSRALRLEFRPRGVRVCVVSPGRVDTHFNGKEPGQRPRALSAADVAEVAEFALRCSPNTELTELRLDSMTRLP
jgi:NAD(P)-dependent dehydrogenase (short-subunit alcohol dehydrogenase family)